MPLFGRFLCSILVSCFLGLLAPVAAMTFPTATVGETFTGSITIDPSTPCSTCGVYDPFVYETFFNAGSISVNVGGTTFSGNSLYEEVYYDVTPSGPLGQWAGYTTTDTGAIQIILDGTTRSTSIFPLDLSHYQPVPPIDQISFYGVRGDGIVYSYSGNFTSFVQQDQLANFTFAGTITGFQVIMPEVSEPATWAMLLIGFAGIGLVTRRIQWGIKRTGSSPVTAKTNVEDCWKL
jgi:hypothetical protein